MSNAAYPHHCSVAAVLSGRERDAERSRAPESRCGGFTGELVNLPLDEKQEYCDRMNRSSAICRLAESYAVGINRRLARPEAWQKIEKAAREVVYVGLGYVQYS